MIVHFEDSRIKTIQAADRMVSLLPGNNEIENDLWEVCAPQVKGDPRIKVITTAKNEEDKEVKAPKLSDLKAKQAEAVVKETYNLVTLESWKEKEGRSSVRAVIEKQITVVQTHGNEN